MKDRKVFIASGMNSDVDARNCPVNMYLFAQNSLVNNPDGQNEGSIQNRKGNTLITFQLPNGENKCIGTCEDTNRNAVVYFVYNDQNAHCILRYNIKERSIDKIVYGDPILNFQEDHQITHSNIIGDLLYWTDGYFEKFTWEPPLEFPDIGFNGPRKINMVKAYNYTNQVNVPALQKYTAITEQALDRIKYPPAYQPVAEYATDSNSKFNNLVGNLFQFAYAYVYDDNEVSVLSPISDVPIPLGQEFSDGTYSIEMPILNNVINVTVNTGPETAKQIRLFSRRLNNGDWYLFDTIEKYDQNGLLILSNNTSYLYGLSNGSGFYNNEVMLSQDQANLSRTFDFIGQIVDSQTYLSDNRIIDGGITENYDNVEIDVSLQTQLIDVEFANSIQNIVASITQPSSAPPMQFPLTGARIEIIFPAVGIVNALYNILIRISTVSNPTNPTVFSYSHILTPSETYPDDLMNSFYTIINNSKPPTDGVSIDIPSRKLIYSAAYLTYEEPQDPDAQVWIFDPLTVTCNLAILIGNPIVSSFKEGFNHYFGVQYYDRAQRHGAVNKKKESSLYIPFITETGYQGISSSEKKATHIDWAINHQPPEWATHYQWFYAKQTPKFVQYYYTEAQLLPDGIHITVNDKFVLLVQTRPKSRLESYTFTPGDRVRFIASGQFAVPNQWLYFPEFIDTEIVGFDVTTGEIIIEDIGFTSRRIDILAGYDYNIIEIYTPRKIDDESIYKAIGPKLPIYAPHTDQRAHIGANGVVQTYSTTYINEPLIRIDIEIVSQGIYRFKFVIAYPYNPLIPIQYFGAGAYIHILGLTDPQSQFLNGTHVIDYVQIIQGTGEMGIFVNTNWTYPSLTQPFYQDFPPFAGGYIAMGIFPGPATGTFDQGDVYVKGRFAVEPPLIPVESDRLSDYYPSDAISIGHPSAVVPDIKRQKYSFLRHSGQYLEDTRINNLSRVLFLDKTEISNENGPISAMRQVGDTLKVLQTRKNNSFGVMIQQLSTATGSEIPVATTTRILSTIRPSVLDFGCSNPESVIVNDRYIYWYDANYGYAMRDDANGMDVISNKGMKQYFKDMKKLIVSSSSFKVITSFNKKYDEVYFTFIINTFIADQQGRRVPYTIVDTVVWNETTNMWSTHISHYATVEGGIIPVDWYGQLGDTMVSFLGGQLYLEDDNVLYNNYFGTQYEMLVDVVSNADFEKVKVFQEIGLSTNNNRYNPLAPEASWDCPTVDIPATEINPLGQRTRINAKKFRQVEESIYAELPRNILSKRSGTEVQKLINGDVMRGQACVFRLRNASSKKVVLYSVITKWIPSEMSK